MSHPQLVLRTSVSAVTAELEFSTNGTDPVDAVGVVAYLRDDSPVAGDGLHFENPTRTYRVTFFNGSAVSPTSISTDWMNDFTGAFSEALIVVRWRAGLEPERDHWIAVQVEHAPQTGFSVGTVLLDDEAIQLARELGSMRERDLPLPTPSIESDVSYFPELSVSGYRGFVDRQTLHLAKPGGKPGSGLTVLVGSNNSGKSTFIEAFHYLARAGVHAETTFPQTRRNSTASGVDLSILRSDETRLALMTSDIGGSLAEAHWTPAEGTPTKFDIHVTPSRRNFNPFFGNMGPATRDWNIVNQEPSRTEQRDYFPSRLREIARDPVRRAEFNRILERIIGHELNWTIDEFSAGQSYVRLVDENKVWHTSEGLGDGLVSLLFIAEALHDSKPGSLIALDEPELSLHPQLVRRLGRVLSDYASSRQIVVATHSPLILNWTDVANGAVVARVYKRGGVSFVAQPEDATIARVVALSKGNLNNPHTLGIQASEAFFLEDGIILLEGQEDVVFLPHILEDLGLSVSESVFGWGAGGATNMPMLATLFLELGFSKIAAVLDDDGRADTNRAYELLSAMGESVLVRRIPAQDIRDKPAKDGKAAVNGLFDRKTMKVHAHLRDRAKRVFAEALTHVGKTP